MSKGIIIFGTTSGAGKSIIAAMMCRYLHEMGESVSPFKALNISLNSFITKDGGEIGTSQAFQAWCAGLEPERRMNPVLIKPKSKGSSQIIVKGSPLLDTTEKKGCDRSHLWQETCRCHDSLGKDNNILICEGSGAPSELNLRKSDIANVKMARYTKYPILIVGDIEKGGVFAGIYGTYALLPDDLKNNVKGFIINRFRGEPSLLDSGICKLESLIGAPCLGIIPYLNLSFPAEDSLDMDNRCKTRGNGTDIRSIWVENVDTFIARIGDSFDFAYLKKLIGV